MKVNVDKESKLEFDLLMANLEIDSLKTTRNLLIIAIIALLLLIIF